MIWLYLSAACMTLTAAAHSVVGERRLITPILALDAEIMRRPLARKLIRFAWHFTSVLMVLSAVTVLWPGTPSPVVIVTGVTWTMVGLFDAIYSKGEHIGWPLLTASGVFALLGALI